jgi:pSer/pThr/pTyr-binding forkhead associated (FHA) protein
LDRAVKIFRRLRTLHDLASARLDQGKILAVQISPLKAMEAFEEALRLAEQADNFQTQGQAIENMASLYADTDSQKAAELYERALDVYKKGGDHSGTARLLERRAKILQSRVELTREQWLKVDTDFARSAEEYRLAGDVASAERVRLERAWGYLLNLRDGIVTSVRGFQKDVDLGRSPASVFEYKNNLVSRKHIELYQNNPYSEAQDASPIVFPLRSMNGSSLNGIPIGYARYQPLHSGDVIVFGNEAVQFLEEPPSAPKPKSEHWGVLIRARDFQYLRDEHLWLTQTGAALRPQTERPAEGGPQLEVQWRDRCAGVRNHGDDWVLIQWGKKDDYRFAGRVIEPESWTPIGIGPAELRTRDALKRSPRPEESFAFHILPLCDIGTNGCCR